MSKKEPICRKTGLHLTLVSQDIFDDPVNEFILNLGSKGLAQYQNSIFVMFGFPTQSFFSLLMRQMSFTHSSCRLSNPCGKHHIFLPISPTNAFPIIIPLFQVFFSVLPWKCPNAPKSENSCILKLISHFFKYECFPNVLYL